MSAEVYAIIDSDGLVVDVQLWDSVAEWQPPENTTAILCGDSGYGIGSTYKDGVFTPPPAPEVSEDELIAQAEQQKSNLLAEASQVIAILQDAVDLGMATDEETTRLTAWRQYRVLLNRVDTSSSANIVWPAKPEN